MSNDENPSSIHVKEVTQDPVERYHRRLSRAARHYQNGDVVSSLTALGEATEVVHMAREYHEEQGHEENVAHWTRRERWVIALKGWVETNMGRQVRRHEPSGSLIRTSFEWPVEYVEKLDHSNQHEDVWVDVSKRSRCLCGSRVDYIQSDTSGEYARICPKCNLMLRWHRSHDVADGD